MDRRTYSTFCIGERAFACFLVLLVFLWTGGNVQAQQNGHGVTTPSASTSTEERVQTEAWWPTMSTAPLEAYAGSAGCVRCHADETAAGDGTAMQRAASRGVDAALQRELAAEPMGAASNSSSAPLSYKLQSAQGTLLYIVTNAQTKKTQQLDWVMGAEDLGRTFVYESDDHWYQSRMSLYENAPKLDVTTGLAVQADVDLTEALGKTLTTSEVRHCFSCHTVHATSAHGFEPMHAEAGVGCEACHGPGAAHSKNMAIASPTKGKDLAVFNPAKLSPSDSIDFCGACHRTFDDVTTAANAANDASVVRFQPYRLEESRCWRATQDARLTCVACHDPHQPLNRNDLSYDKRCLACHAAAHATNAASESMGHSCPTGVTERCVSCHMQKVRVASMHGQFTDHLIRVANQADAFPR